MHSFFGEGYYFHNGAVDIKWFTATSEAHPQTIGLLEGHVINIGNIKDIW